MTIDVAHLNHPCEDALERFLLNRCFGDELADVEMHILCCDSCVARLEKLDLEISAIKLCRHVNLADSIDEAEKIRRAAFSAA